MNLYFLILTESYLLSTSRSSFIKYFTFVLNYIEEENDDIDIGFQVLIFVVKGISITWYIITLCPLKIKGRFRETYHLHP